MYCLRGVSLSHAATLSMQPTSSTIDDIRLTTRRSLPHPRRQWRSPMPATIPLRFPSPVAGQVLDPPSGNPHPGRASADSTRRGTVPRESRWAGPPAGPDAAPGSRSPGASCRVPGRRVAVPATPRGPPPAIGASLSGGSGFLRPNISFTNASSSYTYLTELSLISHH